ncbi:MAG: penicillin-binding transpeptidase domain-containing protein, partial [Candidatus Staskawiczbacteria bacterium]|nr:penicillin-binding transpeptidase domain-containing protein [Candidatus Staskawiczbacteria bacterium]
FKPFAYATAFEKGYTANTVIWDVRTEFNPNCDPSGYAKTGVDGSACYNPENYDGTNNGPVTLRRALSGSLNIPAVKVLYLAGIQDTIKTAEKFGITTLTDTKNYGLSLVLGGGDVNLLEMTSAFGVFATEGNYIPAVTILKVTDTNGNIIEENKKQPVKVLDTQIARQISDILSDNKARTPVFGPNSALYVPGYQVAAKTGTTTNYRDGWTMGYTPSVVIGVWTGNSDNSPTKDIGVGIAAPMWNKVMQKILSANPAEKFTPPDPIKDRSLVLLGQLPQGDTNTILYYVDRNNPLGSQPQNPANDPQYSSWQAGINNWLIATGQYQAPVETPPKTPPPTETPPETPNN